MFKATIVTNVLQASIRAISAVIDECKFEITADGMTARAVCPANASMCLIDLPSEVFTRFDATECELGIDLRRFSEILGMAEKSGDVNLELDEDTHKLNIDMGGLSYTLALLDPSTLRKSPNVPQLDLPAEIVLSGAVFRRMTKAAAMTSDHMRVGVSGDTFFMEAIGDGDAVRLDLVESELIGLKAADVSSLYSLDYLVDFSKGIGTADEVTLHLGRDLPATITFESSRDCSVTYILAPRIEGD